LFEPARCSTEITINDSFHRRTHSDRVMAATDGANSIYVSNLHPDLGFDDLLPVRPLHFCFAAAVVLQ
jgi:hypothetical protein